MLTLLPSSGRQVLSTESGTRRQPVFAAAVLTTTTTYYTMTDPSLRLPIWKTAVDTSHTRFCRLQETPGWAAVAEQRELRESGGHAASPHPQVLLRNHPKERPGVPTQHPRPWILHPATHKYRERPCFLEPQPWGARTGVGWASYFLSLSRHHPPPLSVSSSLLSQHTRLWTWTSLWSPGVEAAGKPSETFKVKGPQVRKDALAGPLGRC